MNRNVLAQHAQLQQAFHPGGLPEPGTAAWAEYVRYNALALVKELSEFQDEVEVRPWKDPAVLNRDAAIEELVDVFFFTANLLLSVGCTDDELEVAHQAKLVENLLRLQTGRSKPIVVQSTQMEGHE